jgi:hypothetical protein
VWQWVGFARGIRHKWRENFVARHLIRNLHRPPPPYRRPFSLLFPLSDLLLAAPFSLDSNSPAAIPTAEAALDGGVPTATSSTGRDDDGGVAGIVDVDGDDFAWVDQWIEDGGDAAGFWAAPGEAGPLTGGIWGTPIGDETLADGVVAVGEAVAADEPTSMSDLAQTDATDVDMEGENLAAVGGSSSFADSINLGMWY